MSLSDMSNVFGLAAGQRTAAVLCLMLATFLAGISVGPLCVGRPDTLSSWAPSGISVIAHGKPAAVPLAGCAHTAGLDSSSPTIHVVYALCGGAKRLEDLLVSLTSMYVMAQNDTVVYDVHVISDGSVTQQHLARFSKKCAPIRPGLKERQPSDLFSSLRL